MLSGTNHLSRPHDQGPVLALLQRLMHAHLAGAFPQGSQSTATLTLRDAMPTFTRATLLIPVVVTLSRAEW